MFLICNYVSDITSWNLCVLQFKGLIQYGQVESTHSGAGMQITLYNFFLQVAQVLIFKVYHSFTTFKES